MPNDHETLGLKNGDMEKKCKIFIKKINEEYKKMTREQNKGISETKSKVT